jgi:uncharacterized protein
MGANAVFYHVPATKFGEFVTHQPDGPQDPGREVSNPAREQVTREPARFQPSLPGSLGQRLIIGPEGVRSGWRLFLYLCFATLLYFALAEATSRLQQTSLNILWLNLIAECGLLVAAVVPAVVMAKLEGRPFGVFGLPLERACGAKLWLGMLWGLAAITGLMVALRGVNAFDFGHIALHGARIWTFAAYHGLFFLVVALFEEFLLRGYSLFTLSRGVGFWPAAVLLSIVFGAIHLANPGESWRGSAATAIIGFFFCLTLRRTGDLWFAVGFHATWDWGESYLYSVPDSGQKAIGHLLSSSLNGPGWLTGGSAGPEASVLWFVLMGLLTAAFGLLYREAMYPRSS